MHLAREKQGERTTVEEIRGSVYLQGVLPVLLTAQTWR